MSERDCPAVGDKCVKCLKVGRFVASSEVQQRYPGISSSTADLLVERSPLQDSIENGGKAVTDMSCYNRMDRAELIGYRIGTEITPSFE